MSAVTAKAAATTTRVVRTLRLYLVLLGAAFRAEAQYRANLFFALLGAMAHQMAAFAFIWVVVDRFGAIGGWSLAELAFLYGMRLTAHGIFTFFGTEVISSFDMIIREGEFDRFLIRPLNPFVQLISRRTTLLVLGDLLGGVTLLVVGATTVDVDWTPLSVGYLMLALFGGAMVEGALQLAFGALSFRLLSTESFRFGLDNIFSTAGGYPLAIFPAAARFGFTFVIPLAFLAYFPATVLLDRTDEIAVPNGLAYLSPAVGLAMLVAAYRFWVFQSRHYTSSGH